MPLWNKYAIKVLYLNKQGKRTMEHFEGTAKLFGHQKWMWLMLFEITVHKVCSWGHMNIFGFYVLFLVI